MTILAFYPVDNELNWDRQEFDYGTHEEAFKKMWENRKRAEVTFYDMDSNWQYDATSLGQFMAHSGDFEEDYNNEEWDGGHWVKVLSVRSDYVKRVIKES